eukprot:1656168-Pleurochrysis_carterae.AAC.1
MVETKIAMACNDRRLLLVVAGELSSQQLRERVGAEYCIALLGQRSGDEEYQKMYREAMLRLPASSDGGNELVVPETEDGIETAEWRQRAGATA